MDERPTLEEREPHGAGELADVWRHAMTKSGPRRLGSGADQFAHL